MTTVINYLEDIWEPKKLTKELTKSKWTELWNGKRWDAERLTLYSFKTLINLQNSFHTWFNPTQNFLQMYLRPLQKNTIQL